MGVQVLTCLRHLEFSVGVVIPVLEVEKLKCKVKLGRTAGTRTRPPSPPPTHRPLPALGGHVTEDRHGHAGARGIDEVHAVHLVALGVDVIAVQGLLKATPLQSWGRGRGA